MPIRLSQGGKNWTMKVKVLIDCLLTRPRIELSLVIEEENAYYGEICRMKKMYVRSN